MFLSLSLSSECHHPRSSLPVRCMLGAAVPAGGPVHPGAHGARHEARRLQEAQQRGTESLPQPAGQRGRGQGAAAGGQQRITTAKGGRQKRSDPTPPAHTDRQIHTFFWTHSHLRHTSDSSAMKRGLCPQHKSGHSFLSSPFFILKAGYCEDSLRTLCKESVLSIFLGCSGKGVTWLSWTLIFGFYKAVTEWSETADTI